MTTKQGPSSNIILDGARENNLKDISLHIPKGQITVFTGISGSGKSSVVFDTIAVESQRQLNETYSWFIRNRLPKHERPKADTMQNLSTAIVVDQKPIGGNARSTVGTMSEIHSMLRVLFSRYAEPSAGPSNLYSFNDPQGMCEKCQGLGRITRMDLDLLLDYDKTLNEGAIRSQLFAVGTFPWRLYAESGLFDPDKPLKKFTKKEWELFLHGGGFRVDRSSRQRNAYSNEYEGIAAKVNRRYLKNGLDNLKAKERREVETFVTTGVCDVCNGGRLNKAALASKINGHDIADYCVMEVSELITQLRSIDIPSAHSVVNSALAALERVESIGLGYLNLNRETSTLSGGEGQRLKTVRHLGSSLTDLIYIFDEPSVGLHPRDVHRLNDLLRALRDKGNTVLVVEHDRDVIAIADHVVDMGPGAGTHGGQVVFEGTVKQLRRSATLTGKSLNNVPGLKQEFREPTGRLPIRKASLHNLHDISVDVPTGILTAVTGVAGSGKSTLMSKVFVQQHPDTVMIDQSAIGVSTRSTPATYVDIMDSVRKLFAQANNANPGLFSFNSEGACPACKGRGFIETDLAYMDPVTTVCETCQGTRYRKDVLNKYLGGKNIVDVLALTVEEALEYFEDDSILHKLRLLSEVGLPYLTLGQALSTLSGGERQRIKLAHRLRDTGNVYVFDEPTTGLHMADIDNLLKLLDRLVDSGNTVVVIEHDVDVIKHADWVIDLGPEAGRHGGHVLFEGTPAALVRDRVSHTAEYLRKDLEHAM